MRWAGWLKRREVYGEFAATAYSQRPIEAWQAGQTAAKLETVWRVRWSASSAAITAGMRLTENGRVYELTGVTEPEWHQVIQLVGIARADTAETL